MALTLVLLPTISITSLQSSLAERDGGRTTANRLGWYPGSREQARDTDARRTTLGARSLYVSRSASACVKLCVHYKRKAAKRLRLLGARERRIVRLLGKIRRMRGSSVRPLAVPHLSAWLCIHRYEGSWSDAGDPYWGGLQMDRNFMQTYAPRWLLARGWANLWSPREQMWVAERAYRTRGFSPWPNTAAMCGLL